MASPLVQPTPEQELSSNPSILRRKPWWLLFWIALPVMLWVAFRNVSSGDIWATLQNLSLGSILLLLAVNVIVVASFSGRWWLILRAQGHQRSYWSLAGYRLAGFGITYFTPGPQLGGEPLQVYLLTQREHVPITTAVASVTLDKLLELLSNFTFLLIGVATILASGMLGDESNYLFLLLPVGLLLLPAGYLLALWTGRQPVTKLIGRLSVRFSGLQRQVRWPAALHAAEEETGRFVQGHPGTIQAALIISFLIWVLLVLEFGLALRFLGLSLNLAEVITLLTAARLAFLLPIPAGIGALETGQMLAVGLIGASPAIGISLSLMIRVRDVALGGLGLWWGGLLTRS
jgi:glycosyltransferase 2 family protein